MEERFDIFGEITDNTTQNEIKKNEPSEDTSLVCEAIQIVKMVKSVMQTRREIVDTIKIDGSKMTYERALRVAKAKAQAIGNCMVVEKLERVVIMY